MDKKETNQTHEEEHMIEMIRTFYGKVCGIHTDKTTVVVESVAWFCPKCKKVWLDREQATSHNCKGKENGNKY